MFINLSFFKKTKLLNNAIYIYHFNLKVKKNMVNYKATFCWIWLFAFIHAMLYIATGNEIWLC